MNNIREVVLCYIVILQNTQIKMFKYEDIISRKTICERGLSAKPN